MTPSVMAASKRSHWEGVTLLIHIKMLLFNILSSIIIIKIYMTVLHMTVLHAVHKLLFLEYH